MAFQDRAYYRDSNRPGGNPLMWLLTGSITLGTWFGITVRLHASMVVTVAYVLLVRPYGTVYNSVVFSVILFASVLLHEFGHCFGSRSVGGNPFEIMLTPLGGLALADAPRRPWATFWTVLCGPLVNLLLCVASGATIYFSTHTPSVIPWNPFHMILPPGAVAYYAWWTFVVNWGLFTFNVLWPVFPLDGGQMLQSLLWVRLGYYRATLIACTVGIVGAIVMTMLGLGFFPAGLFLALIGISCLLTCISMRAQLKADGPWAFEDEGGDYSASLWNEPAPKKRRHVSRRAIKKAQRHARLADLEQARIDAILAKVSSQGMQSLTWGEKRALHKATERQRMMESPGKRH